MRFKIDENLPAELAGELPVVGHEAETVLDEGVAGPADSLILERVSIEERILLTLDIGIGDIRSYPPELYSGIILFRTPTSGRGSVLLFIRDHLDTLLQADLAGYLLVVTERGIRIR